MVVAKVTAETKNLDFDIVLALNWLQLSAWRCEYGMIAAANRCVDGSEAMAGLKLHMR